MIGSSTFQRDRVVEDVRLPVGHDPQRAVRPAHVPVGLGARGHLGRVVGPELPHRVDGQQAAHQRRDAEDDEEEPAGLGGVHGQHREADDVLLRAAGAGPLGVLVVDEQQHVGGDQREQQARDQQHVDDEQARDDVGAGELAAEEQERHVGADDRLRQDEAFGGADAGAGEQVVGERVAGEPLEGAQDQQQRADRPVQLARLAVRAGEEDPQQVDHHRADEEHRRPVVDLPHQQAAADVERQSQRRGEGLGHLDAAQLRVAAFVRRLAHARVEPQGEEDAAEEQDHEAPERDLAQHEGPVVGEDLAQVLLGQGGQAEPVVSPLGDGTDAVGLLRGGSRGVRRGHFARVDAHDWLLRFRLIRSCSPASRAPRSWVRQVP